jgi:hypothetical protein
MCHVGVHEGKQVSEPGMQDVGGGAGGGTGGLGPHTVPDGAPQARGVCHTIL